MRTSLACLFTIVLVGATAGNAEPAQPSSVLPRPSPVTVVRGFILVTATINGSGPFRMLLDTGASSCSLTPRATRRAGLALDHRVVLSTLVREKIVPATSNARVQIGVAAEDRVEVMVQDLDGARKVDGGIDGELGQSFFQRSPYLIDYRQKQLTLGHEAERLAEKLALTVEASVSNSRMVVPVVLQNESRAWRLTLDSGTSDLLLFCGGRCPRFPEMEPGTLTTDSGELAVQRGVLKRLRIGTSVLPGDEVFISNSTLASYEEGVAGKLVFSHLCGSDSAAGTTED